MASTRNYSDEVPAEKKQEFEAGVNPQLFSLKLTHHGLNIKVYYDKIKLGSLYEENFEEEYKKALEITYVQMSEKLPEHEVIGELIELYIKRMCFMYVLYKEALEALPQGATKDSLDTLVRHRYGMLLPTPVAHFAYHLTSEERAEIYKYVGTE